ncbi:MAG TPA: hypothetical protein VKR55_03390 [Bradyrhizobium sp.]|uniref:hypothetical protein n=1 Tax=Bradyrhizobium sp. TaxID=376 RepID=UPI002BB776C8|nr:hypothetical protein [Bradyrhizobium sp.]HLZ01177.1 hypothetical protein [Bradyrhizobium sp.]
MSDGQSISANTAKSIQSLAAKAITTQSEFSEKLVEFNRHWLERIQTEANELWDLLWRSNGTPSLAEKIKISQAWLKGATERGAQDAMYALEAARTLGAIELKAQTAGKDTVPDSKAA